MTALTSEVDVLPKELMMRTGILIGIAILAVLAGACELVTTAVGLPGAPGKFGIWMAGFDPNNNAVPEPTQRYKELYSWTGHILHDRIHYQFAFHYTIGTSLVVVGLLVIAWTADHQRLRRRIRDLAQSHPSLDGDGSPARITQEN